MNRFVLRRPDGSCSVNLIWWWGRVSLTCTDTKLQIASQKACADDYTALLDPWKFADGSERPGRSFFFPFSQMLFVHQHEWVRKARFWMHLLNWFLCREACRADKFFMHDVPENADKGRLPHRRFVLHGDKVWPAGWCLHWPMKWTVRINLKSVVVSTIYRDKTL